MSKYPKVKIETVSLEDSKFAGGDKIWYAQTLIDFCKAKKYPIFDMPLAGIDLSKDPFTCQRLDDFIFECKRTMDANLDYPIILDRIGQIADGNHRVCKAILEGRTTIKAIRMEEMPAWDEKNDSN